MGLPDSEDEFSRFGDNAYYLRRQRDQKPNNRGAFENRAQHRARLKREKKNVKVNRSK